MIKMMLTDIDLNNITDEIIKNVLFRITKSDYQDADVLIVFGCHLKFAIDERINYALEVLKSKKINKVILTGGIGAKGDFNETEYMLNVLLDNGIDRDMIIMDEKSMTTEENVKNTIELLKSNDLLTNKKIILLSHEPHLKRIGMEFHYQLKNDLFTIIYEYPRNTLVPYDKVIENRELRSLAENEINKIVRFIREGLIDDEEISIENIMQKKV